MDRVVPALRIGPHEIWPPIILAPMSGVTNRTLRALYKPFGFGLTVTEFVSSNALQYGATRTMAMIDQHGLERPGSTQLWGNDPATMAYAAKGGVLKQSIKCPISFSWFEQTDPSDDGANPWVHIGLLQHVVRVGRRIGCLNQHGVVDAGRA